MKKLFLKSLTLLLFFAVKAGAQVDSFMVDYCSFKYNLPTDWVIEQSNDGIPSYPAKNLLIHHFVYNDCFKSFISIRFEKFQYFAPLSRKEEKKIEKNPPVASKIESYGLSGEQITYKEPVRKCSSSLILISRYYPLNDTFQLIVQLNSIASIEIEDSLKNIFDDFSNNFVYLNISGLKKFDEGNSNAFNTLKTDTILYDRKEFKIKVPQSWQSTSLHSIINPSSSIPLYRCSHPLFPFGQIKFNINADIQPEEISRNDSIFMLFSFNGKKTELERNIDTIAGKRVYYVEWLTYYHSPTWHRVYYIPYHTTQYFIFNFECNCSSGALKEKYFYQLRETIAGFILENQI